MKKMSLLYGTYAALLLIGGIIGFLAAGSIPSLIASSLMALLLVFSIYLVEKSKPSGVLLGQAVMLFLFLFFGVRFYNSLKIMPSGVMALVSLTTLLASSYLTKTQKTLSKKRR